MFIKQSQNDTNSVRFKAYKEGYLLPVLQPDHILNSFRYQAVIKRLLDLSGLSEEQFEALYQQLIYNFAAFVQLVPRQTNGLLGGLVSEGMARAILALQMPENQHLSPLKKYALFSAALLCDVGNIVCNHMIIVSDKEGNFSREWNPFEGSMDPDTDKFYKIYPRNYLYQRLQGSINALLARQLMPEAGFLWICSDLDVYAQWLDALNGDDSRGGGIRRSLSLIKLDDIIDLLNSLGQISEEMIAPKVNREGEAFFRWLRDGISNNSIQVNTSDAMVHIVDAGVFVDDKIMKKFTDLTAATIGLFVVKHQVGNLMGIPQKCGEDYLHAMFFGESATFSGRPGMGGALTSRSGILLNDRSILDLGGRYNSISTHLKANKDYQSLMQQAPVVGTVNTIRPTSDNKGK